MTEPSTRRWLIVAAFAAAVVIFAAAAAVFLNRSDGERVPAAATASATTGASPSPTTASPSPSSEPVMRFGEAYTFPDGTATVTVYRYKHNATGFGETFDSNTVFGALDIKFCLKRLPDDATGIEISGYPWTLKFGDGSYGSTGSSGGEAMKPEYPEGRRVRVGTCVRGWLDFEVPKNGKLVEAQYTPDDDQATLVVWK